MSARRASCRTGWASPGSRFVPSTPRPIRPRRRNGDKSFSRQVLAALPESAQGKPIEVWFQDEARAGQQGTLTCIGPSRARGPERLGTAATPRPTSSAQSAPTAAWVLAWSCLMPTLRPMSAHLAEISAAVAPGAHAVLVLDAAAWHGAAALQAPDNITLLLLPPHGPELNPAENVWQYLRQTWLSLQVWDDYTAIVETCCQAWTRFLAQPEFVRSFTTRAWTRANA